MRITNVTWTRTNGTIQATSDIGSGHTLTHTPDCDLLARIGPDAEGFDAHSCSCYISKISLVPLADGTVTAIPGQMMHDLSNAASINKDLWDHMRAWRRIALIIGGVYALDISLSIGRALRWW